jgi:hypothetical protein
MVNGTGHQGHCTIPLTLHQQERHRKHDSGRRTAGQGLSPPNFPGGHRAGDARIPQRLRLCLTCAAWRHRGQARLEVVTGRSILLQISLPSLADDLPSNTRLFKNMEHLGTPPGKDIPLAGGPEASLDRGQEKAPWS